MKLPFLFTVPHGGTRFPDEVRDINMLSSYDILMDGDAFTNELYDFSDISDHVIRTDIARAFVDLNRSPDELPPKYTDGVVKNQTCFNTKIYTANINDKPEIISQLLKRYYFPWHERLGKYLTSENIIACFDCHSMHNNAPPISVNAGKKRPAVCLGNAGGKSASFELISRLKSSFMECLGLENDEVRINDPFSGGYITSRYGSMRPYIQIEINRMLYLDCSSQPLKNNFNQKLKNIMTDFYNKLT